MRIYLIGMPGSGKSTLAKELSEVLDLPYFDLDLEIEKKERKSIPKIFTEFGEDYFRKVEREIMLSFTPDNAIIATGGGTPCFFDNIEKLNSQGKTFFVDVLEDDLADRVWEQQGTRPLLAQENREDIFAAIQEKRVNRLPYYEKAQITIQANKKTPYELAIEIKQNL
ncbi:shikimate kinase [Flammeovirga pectinis]|uniref:Shikimate kinase n=1 Tax=Flammeovirga pectinis TaxID=2494373 RepID=A0A3S9NZ99_9BACT|nr:shikimate kinase [Flammeovirga pectinis]AZQ61226.1 shikimate kinase [Flammeovirga pectinis]